MIITRTPLRISFFSGGSDMPSFYKNDLGAALSVTIDKYIYVMAHKTPHMGVKIMYDKIEHYPDVETMQSNISSETLKYFQINNEITLSSVSDILSKGSGLGSSSAFTVGLVNALSKYSGIKANAGQLAECACTIEMDKCNYPVGKQDQYAAAYGGINLFQFAKDQVILYDTTKIDPFTLKHLENNLLLVYSGVGRSANSILQKQSAAMSDKDKLNLVKRSRDKAYIALGHLIDRDIDSFGALLNDAWMDKKSIVKEITSDYFDDVYARATNAGALGGKLLGAGGGGFFVFYVPQDKRERVKKELEDNTECTVYDFRFTDEGSTILASDIA
jgi:D-glycero-alpha-D-manno-heptose-7-phosphate kinase